MTAISYGREVAVGSGRERRSLLAIARHVDFVLVGTALVLSLIGVVMVYSATRDVLVSEGVSPHYYLERQIAWVVIGIVVMVVVASIDYRRYRQFGYVIYGLVLLSLAGVFVVGRSAYGSQRWYPFGPLDLQPSEFAALGLIVAIATFCSRRQGILSLRDMAGLVLLAAVPMLLVYKQPDLGTAIILGVTLAGMMLAAEVRFRYLVMLFVLVVGGFILALSLHLLHGYQLSRLVSFLNQDKNLKGSNYELSNTKNTISSGGVDGSGLFHGAATNLGLIPNQYTDFIFSAVGEQLGFIGSTVVIGLFSLMALRMLRAAQIARDSFGRLVCVGAVAFLAFSVFENIGANIGIMPITGIPLPFLSYGGSATFAFFATVGLVLNVELRRLGRR